MNKFLLAIILLYGGVSAQASALLKPTTGATQALRARSLDVEADVSGAFARVTATTVYANPNPRQIEADFIYTAPDGATVTGFAYWFKGEKVVARVVEKERAAEIYRLITVQRRDPALVEMIGKNTFRARISPVEARADLKIEVQYVEPLAATKEGWKWNFPLKADTANYPLDAVNLTAKIAGATSATSNFGDFKDGQLSEEKNNVKDAADIEIEVSAPRAPLKVSLFAARDSGSDGFFAIALAPDFSATKPGFAVSGVQTYDVMRDENARVGQTFVAVGRYRGAGEALVKLGQRSVNVKFPEATKAGNIAAQMWGARRIETLSASDKNRAAVVNLSLRFGMPSKWTSWLALPASEKAQFESQLLELEISRAMGSWAQSVAVGDKKREKILRQRAYDYQARLNKLTSYNENLSAQQFRNALNAELEAVTNARQNKSANKAKLARLERGLRARGAVSYRDIRDAQQREWKRRERLATQVRELQEARLDALQKGDARRAQSLLKQSNVAYQSSKKAGDDYDPRSNITFERRRQLATAIERERKNGLADSPNQQRLLLQLRRISPASQESVQGVLEAVRSQLYNADLQKAYRLLATEVQAGRETGAEARRVETRIAELKPFVSPNKPYEDYGNLNYSYANLAATQGADYLNALAKGETAKADALLQRINANIAASKRYSRSSSPNTIDLKSVLARGWSDIKSDASSVLAKEIAAKRENSPAAIEARKRIEEADVNGATEFGSRGYSSIFMPQYAWKGRAHETAYRLVQARQNGDAETAKALEAQLQIEVKNANAKIPNSSYQADNVALDSYIEWEKSRIKNGEPLITSENYALRPGDPLISVSAPANCQKVVAILPSGELLPLVYDAAKKAWQARFDVPTYAREGEYRVKIIMVAADGARQQMTMTFHVDTTAPGGQGGAIFGGDGLDLRLETDGQTDRVSAFTPWNERVELRRDASGIFIAHADVPPDWRGKAAVVRFILTDKAHNRTELSVDWNE